MYMYIARFLLQVLNNLNAVKGLSYMIVLSVDIGYNGLCLIRYRLIRNIAFYDNFQGSRLCIVHKAKSTVDLHIKRSSLYKAGSICINASDNGVIVW